MTARSVQIRPPGRVSFFHRITLSAIGRFFLTLLVLLTTGALRRSVLGVHIHFRTGSSALRYLGTVLIRSPAHFQSVQPPRISADERFTLRYLSYQYLTPTALDPSVFLHVPSRTSLFWTSLPVPPIRFALTRCTAFSFPSSHHHPSSSSLSWYPLCCSTIVRRRRTSILARSNALRYYFLDLRDGIGLGEVDVKRMSSGCRVTLKVRVIFYLLLSFCLTCLNVELHFP